MISSIVSRYYDWRAWPAFSYYIKLNPVSAPYNIVPHLREVLFLHSSFTDNPYWVHCFAPSSAHEARRTLLMYYIIEFIAKFSRRIPFSFRVVHIPYNLSSIFLCCIVYIYFTLSSAPIGKESLAHSLRNIGANFNGRLYKGTCVRPLWSFDAILLKGFELE